MKANRICAALLLLSGPSTPSRLVLGAPAPPTFPRTEQRDPVVPEPRACIAAAREAVGAGEISREAGAAAYKELRGCLSAQLEAGKTAAALSVAQAANEIFHSEPQSGYDYGAVLLLTGGDPEVARAVLKESLQRVGRFGPASEDQRGRALNNLGKIEAARGDLTQARSLFNEAIRLRATDAEPFYNLALVDRRLNDAAACLAHIEAAFARSPRMASRDDYLMAAWAYTAVGRAPGAASILELGIKEFPNAAGLHLELGRALSRQGRPLDALLEYYYEFMNDAGDDPEAAEARRLFTAGIEGAGAPGSSTDAVSWLRTAYSAESPNAARPLEALQKLQTAGHRHPALDLLRARALTAAGRGEEAETVYRDGLLHDPAFLPLYLDLSSLLRAAGRSDEARELVAEAVRRNPSHWLLLGAPPKTDSR